MMCLMVTLYCYGPSQKSRSGGGKFEAGRWAAPWQSHGERFLGKWGLAMARETNDEEAACSAKTTDLSSCKILLRMPSWHPRVSIGCYLSWQV